MRNHKNGGGHKEKVCYNQPIRRSTPACAFYCQQNNKTHGGLRKYLKHGEFYNEEVIGNGAGAGDVPGRYHDGVGGG